MNWIQDSTCMFKTKEFSKMDANHLTFKTLSGKWSSQKSLDGCPWRQWVTPHYIHVYKRWGSKEVVEGPCAFPVNL